MSNGIPYWKEFALGVEKRLLWAQEKHGDRYLQMTVHALGDEIEQEVLDICGWSFLLWKRIRALEGRLNGETNTQNPGRSA